MNEEEYIKHLEEENERLRDLLKSLAEDAGRIGEMLEDLQKDLTL